MKTLELKRYTDNRGALVENTLEKVMNDSRHFFVSYSKAGIIRGNHYHKHKTEWFYIVQGTCKIVTENTTTKKREEQIVKSADDILVNMVPFTAHALQNVGDDEMILLALINEPLDKKNPDTYEYIILT